MPYLLIVCVQRTVHRVISTGLPHVRTRPRRHGLHQSSIGGRRRRLARDRRCWGQRSRRTQAFFGALGAGGCGLLALAPANERRLADPGFSCRHSARCGLTSLRRDRGLCGRGRGGGISCGWSHIGGDHRVRLWRPGRECRGRRRGIGYLALCRAAVCDYGGGLWRGLWGTIGAVHKEKQRPVPAGVACKRMSVQ